MSRCPLILPASSTLTREVFMKRGTLFLILMLLATTLMLSCGGIRQADLIIHGGTIYTMNQDKPVAEALAILDGKIIYVGDEAGVTSFRSEKTGELNLQGGMLLPGLTDSHLKLEGLGESLTELNLVGTESTKEIHAKVMEKILFVRKNLDGGDSSWVIGRGWDQNDWKNTKLPTIRDIPPGPNPVCLWRIDQQTVWVNELALRKCGITKRTADPPGGKIVRDRAGNPTGVLLNKAVNLVTDKIPPSSREERKHRILLALEECGRVGLTGIHDFDVDSVQLELLEELESEGKLTLRVYPVLQCWDKQWLSRIYERGAYGQPSDLLRLRSVMMFIDGGMGARSAALIEPYSDDPDNSGIITSSCDDMVKHVEMANSSGFQVCAYAVGDKGSQMALNAFEKALTKLGPGDWRYRLEHAQLLDPADFKRLGTLEVIPTIMPAHATSDMSWAEDRIGKDRIKYAYAWKTILENAKHAAMGSEAPVESPNPIWGIYAAMTRQDHEGNPKGGWYPEHRLTFNEALHGYTVGAAYAQFAENELGTIEVGKIADLTAFKKDLTKIEPVKMLDCEVLYTIVNGKPVYRYSE